MADDTEPDVVESPEIDAGRALGVSRRGMTLPSGTDVIQPINPSGDITPAPVTQKRSAGAQPIGSNRIISQSRTGVRKLRPGDPEYDNTAEREKYEAEHPFTPSSWRPKQLDPENDRPTASQAAAQREAEIEARRQAAATARTERAAATLKLKTENAADEEKMRGSGQQFYTDAFGKIKPVVEPESGRPLFHQTGWQKGTNPESGTPALVRRNQYGENEYQTPKIVHNPDLTDDKLYYDMGEHGTVEAGPINELINSKDFKISRAARTARRERNKAMWEEASSAVKEQADAAESSLHEVQQQQLGLTTTQQEIQGQIDAIDTHPQANEQVGGVMGIGASLSPVAKQLQAQRAALQSQLDAVGTQQTALAEKASPKGQLARDAKMSKLSLQILRAKARHNEYTDLADDRRTILKQEGKSEADDTTLQSILRAQAMYGESASRYSEIARREHVGPDAAAPQAAGAQSVAAPAPAGDQSPDGVPLIGEPTELAAKGIKAVGGVKIPELVRRYGSGQGAVQPASVVRIHQRIADIQQTLENKDTKLDQKVRDSMGEESQYLDQLLTSRFSKLTPEQQERVTEITRDSTMMDKVKGLGKSTAEAGAVGGGGFLKGLGNLMADIGPMGDMQGFQMSPDFIRAREQFMKMRQNETPLEHMERIKKDPIYQLGQFIQDSAHEAYSKNPHEDEGAVSKALNAAGEAAGGFAPLIASGPMAPVTAALQTTGDEMDRIYQDQIKKGVDPQRAADFAQKRALLSGGVQGALFALLPKPLQKAGNKIIVDRIAGTAFTKFMANRLAQATEGAAMGGASAVASNVAADRPATEGVAEAASGLGLAQAMMPRAPSPGRAPEARPTEPGRPSPAPAPEPPVAPSSEAPKPKSAEESATVFEPALNERANQSPPAKPASESAKVFNEAADTAEANAKVDSQQEAKAQKLVDQIQEATGKPRDEILATRKGIEHGEWMKQLESEARYQKNPLIVDPARRTKELNEDLRKLNDEWSAHLEKTASRRQRTEHNEAVRAADDAKRQDIGERSTAIRNELVAAEHIRRSPQGLEDLRRQLTEQETQSAEDARKLRTPELEGRRNAIEDQLTEQDRIRRSAAGGEKLREELAGQEKNPPEGPAGAPAEKPTPPPPPESLSDTIHAMNGKEFAARYQKRGAGELGLTDEAIALGNETKTPEGIKELATRRDTALAEFKKARAGGDLNEAWGLATKNQFFNEAYEQATKTGAYGPAAESVAARRTSKQMFEDIMQKNPNADPEATKMMLGKKIYEARDIPISEIGPVFGEKTVQPGVVEKYTSTKSDEPITLNRVAGEQGGKLRAIDGKHRLTAAIARGEKTIKAFVPVDEKVGKTPTGEPTNAIPKQSPSEVSVRQTPKGSEGIRVENPIDQGAAGSREAGGTAPAIQQEVAAQKGATVETTPNGKTIKPTTTKEAAVADLPAKKKMAVQKEFLLEAVQKAAKEAPSDPNYLEGISKGLNRDSAITDFNTGRELITFEVPGDGEYRIHNVREALEEFAEKVQSKFGKGLEAPKPPQVGIPKMTPEIRAEHEVKPGLISGTRAEKWADKTIKDRRGVLYSGIDPELLAAHAIKGAALIERDIRDFSAWSKEMVKQFGKTIEPHLKSIYDAATGISEGTELAGAPPDVKSEVRSIGVRQKIGNYFAKGDVEKAMAATRDAVDNMASNYGVSHANVVANQLDGAFKKPERAVSRDALAFAVEAASDPKKLAEMAKKIASSDKASPEWTQRALAAIEFAKTNLDRLKPIVAEFNQQTGQQVALERSAGIDTLEYPNYVPHRQDIDQSGGHAFTTKTGGDQRGFMKVREHPTFADSIAAGVDPRSLDAVDLLQSRLSSGQQIINRNAWVEGLKRYTDPVSKNPVAVEVQRQKRADGSSYAKAPNGYTVEFLGNKDIAVHNGYEGMFSALTDPSWWSKSPIRRSAQQLNAIGKSTALLVDSFHLGRLAFWNGAARLNAFGTLGGGTEAPKFWSHERGVNMLDQTPGEIARMAKEDGRGPEEIKQLLDQKRKLNLALETGFNVGKITDALHNDAFHEIVDKLTFGDKLGISKFNRWLFDRFQRGAMSEIWLMEYDRQRAMSGNKKLTDPEVARTVSQDVNTRFGNLGRQGLFKSRTSQDIMKMLFLAPQWNEGLIRSELGGAKQITQSLVRGVSGQGLATGLLARSVATMVVGQFIANQLINQYTRKKFTWENPEEGMGAKLSAWIPDKVGGGSGFFLHPMGLGAEITHLMMSRWEKTDSFREATAAFLRGRLSSITRPLATYVLGTNSLGQRIKPDELFKESVKEAIPKPIPSQSVAGAVRSLATGEKSEQFPGQFEKQLLSTVGVKTDQAPSEEQRMRALAHDFNVKHGVTQSAEYNISDYAGLNAALHVGNKSEALSQIDELLKKKTAMQLVQQYHRQVHAPFTGVVSLEAEFSRSLTPEQRRAAVIARRAREKMRTDFNSLLRQYLSQHKIEGAVEARQTMLTP